MNIRNKRQSLNVTNETHFVRLMGTSNAKIFCAASTDAKTLVQRGRRRWLFEWGGPPTAVTHSRRPPMPGSFTWLPNLDTTRRSGHFFGCCGGWLASHAVASFFLLLFLPVPTVCFESLIFIFIFISGLCGGPPARPETVALPSAPTNMQMTCKWSAGAIRSTCQGPCLKREIWR